jgi:hypothetical protein
MEKGCDGATATSLGFTTVLVNILQLFVQFLQLRIQILQHKAGQGRQEQEHDKTAD